MSTIGFGDVVPTKDDSRLFTVVYIWFFLFFMAFPLAGLVSEIMMFFLDQVVCIIKEDYAGYDAKLRKRKYHGTKIAILSIAIVAHVAMGIGLTHYFMGHNDSIERYALITYIHTYIHTCIC